MPARTAPARALPLLQLQGICKQRGGRAVLQGLGLTLERGEIFGLLGANGCGKSTALHVVAGLLPADSGQVLFDGAPASQRNRARLGLCPQQPALYRELRPAENLGFFASLYGLRGAQHTQRVAQLMQRCGLEPHAATPAGRLSGGWQQRLNLAVALVHAPELLLLDEPTSALDPQARQSFWALIESLRDSGTTLLLTTHQLAEAERLCTRVGLMQHGHLRAVGTPAELCAQVPGVVVARLEGPDTAALRARAAQLGWPLRHWGGGLACLLPRRQARGGGAPGAALGDVVQAFEGVALTSVALQPVGLEHAYLELMGEAVGAA